MVSIIQPQFLTRLNAELVDEDHDIWRLIRELTYASNILDTILTIPAGFTTDFDSVPRIPLAYWLTGNTGRAAAAVHDYLYQTHLCKEKSIADNVFYEAMRALGVPAWRSYLKWLGVKAGGQSSWVSGPSRLKIFSNDELFSM